VALVGTTGSGKSELAMEAAIRRGDVEIVSVDSMCVYRRMDLATAKPTAAARSAVPHHLIDVVDVWEEFTVSQFKRFAAEAIGGIEGRGHRAFLVGGTGLYLRAVVDDLQLPGRWPEIAARLEEEADAPGGLPALYERLALVDPQAAARITPTNRRRIVRALEVVAGSGRPFSAFGPGLESYPPTRVVLLGVPFDPPVVDRRIGERFQRWLAEGLVDEVRALAALPEGLSRTARQALGYRELLAHVEDGAALEECVELAVRRTRAYARRQWAWFRRDPRIRWIAPGEDPVGLVTAALASGDLPGVQVCGPAAVHGSSTRGARLEA